MAGLKDYSTTAASNATVGSVNFAENQNPNSVNDSARQLMADIRSDRDNIEWRDWGHTVVYGSATTFTISSATSLSSVYTVGRRIKVTDSSTLYGVIMISAYAGTTQTVTVRLDSGSLSASLTNIALGNDPINNPVIPSVFYSLEWRDFGHAPVYSSATVFTISTTTNLSTTYTVGRRIRATDSSTLYGIITASSFGSPTQTVTVNLDSGSLSASLTKIALGLDPTNSPVVRPVYGARAYRSSAASVLDGFDYEVYFDTVSYDTATCLSLVSPGGNNLTLITVPLWATRMRIDVVISFAASATGKRGVYIHSTDSAGSTEVSLTPELRNISDADGSGVTLENLSTGYMSVTGGTYYKISTYQNSGGTLDITDSWIAVEFK